MSSGVTIDIDGVIQEIPYGNPVIKLTYHQGDVTVAKEQNGDVTVTPNFNAYYVSPTGDDGTGLGTFVSPFKSLSHASTVASPGDQIILLDGEYLEHQTINAHGTVDRNIFVHPLEFNNVKLTGGLTIQGTYIKVSLTIETVDSIGLIMLNCDNVKIKDTRVDIMEPYNAITLTQCTNCELDSTNIMGKPGNTNDAIVLYSGDSNRIYRTCFCGWYGEYYRIVEAKNTQMKL